MVPTEKSYGELFEWACRWNREICNELDQRVGLIARIKTSQGIGRLEEIASNVESTARRVDNVMKRTKEALTRPPLDDADYATLMELGYNTDNILRVEMALGRAVEVLSGMPQLLEEKLRCFRGACREAEQRLGGACGSPQNHSDCITLSTRPGLVNIVPLGEIDSAFTRAMSDEQVYLHLLLADKMNGRVALLRPSPPKSESFHKLIREGIEICDEIQQSIQQVFKWERETMLRVAAQIEIFHLDTQTKTKNPRSKDLAALSLIMVIIPALEMLRSPRYITIEERLASLDPKQKQVNSISNKVLTLTINEETITTLQGLQFAATPFDDLKRFKRMAQFIDQSLTTLQRFPEILNKAIGRFLQHANPVFVQNAAPTENCFLTFALSDPDFGQDFVQASKPPYLHEEDSTESTLSQYPPEAPQIHSINSPVDHEFSQFDTPGHLQDEELATQGSTPVEDH